MMKTLAAAVLGCAFGLGTAATAAAQTVAISTLPPGAVNNVQAQAIAKVVQENTDLQVRVVTFNSPAAIIGAVEAGQVEFAFTSNDEAGQAVRGKGEHEGRPMQNLRLAAFLFPFQVGIVVRADSDIRTVADLKGRRFPTGWQGFVQGIDLSNAMLATAGLSLDDMDGVPTANLIRGADDLKAGKLDATMFAIGAPKMAEVDSSVGGIRWLPLTNTPEALAAMQAVRPEYHMVEVQPAPNLVGLTEPTVLMEYAVVLLAGAHVPEETVYKAVKAIYENKDDLVAGHPSFNALDPQNLATPQPDMQYHPGAVLFYKEMGVWKE